MKRPESRGIYSAQVMRAWLPNGLSLRWRLTLWCSTLLVFTCLALVVSLNVLARLGEPTAVAARPQASPPAGISAGSASSVEALGPGARPVETLVRGVERETLNRVLMASLGALAVAVLVGSAGAYWLAGGALAPVKSVSRTARQISMRTLDTRLKPRGPDDELRELTETFNSMLDRLERAFDQQNRFVGDAAHELRTPLTVLRTTIEVVRRDANADLGDYVEMTDVLDRSLARLERLIDDMLLLAEEDWTQARSEVSLIEVAEEVVAELQPLAERCKVRVCLLPISDVQVYGNPTALTRAVRNIVENGIKYNREEGRVLIEVAQGDGEARVSVTDTGIGIPDEEQRLIFERFYRVDRSRSRRNGSTGLGLSIAARVIEQHGGEIRVISKPTEGSTFVIELPTITQE